MSDDATLTVTLPADTIEKSAVMAERESSTPDALAALAVADFVQREAATVATIERGRADARAGRISSQADVMRDVRAIIDAARAG